MAEICLGVAVIQTKLKIHKTVIFFDCLPTDTAHDHLLNSHYYHLLGTIKN